MGDASADASFHDADVVRVLSCGRAEPQPARYGFAYGTSSVHGHDNIAFSACPARRKSGTMIAMERWEKLPWPRGARILAHIINK